VCQSWWPRIIPVFVCTVPGRSRISGPTEPLRNPVGPWVKQAVTESRQWGLVEAGGCPKTRGWHCPPCLIARCLRASSVGPAGFSRSSPLISRNGMRIAHRSRTSAAQRIARSASHPVGRRSSGGQTDGHDASSSTGKSGSHRSMSASTTRIASRPRRRSSTGLSCGVHAHGRMPHPVLPRGMRQPG
jgi:hypothetical protein